MAHEIVPGTVGWLTTLRLGIRNLARHRRRTWITATTVAIAILLLQLSFSLLIGLEQQSYDNLINYQTAHAKIFAEGYFADRDEYPLEPNLGEIGDLQATVTSVAGIAATTPRLVFFAQISNGVDQIPCQGVGIDVEGSDDDVFRLPATIVEGSYLSESDEGMLLGSGLAKLFSVSAGDWLTILCQTVDGAYEAIDLPITGIVGSGNPLIDRNTLMIPLTVAQDILDMEGMVTELAVRFSAGSRESAALSRLTSTLESEDGLEVKGWRALEENFIALVKMKRTGNAIMLGIFALMAVVGITNTILMATYERTREIGMLMAMGMRRQGIRKLFMTEGTLCGLLGGALGTAIAFVLICWINIKGWNLTATYGEMDIGYPVKDIIYLSLDLSTMVVIGLSTGVLAGLAALYPAVRASRLDAAEALRHV